MNYNLQRKYRSLERRRESKKMPKMPKLPEKLFYRILDDGSGDQSRSKKHVKFQLLGEEDDPKTGVLCSDFSPVPARYPRVVRAQDTDTFQSLVLGYRLLTFGKKSICFLSKCIFLITLTFFFLSKIFERSSYRSVSMQLILEA